MQYIYHGMPDKMVGSELEPLNGMELTHPDLYKKYKEKYKGREKVLTRKIDLLECFWNDVVQFLPVHPHKVFELQVRLGLIPTIPTYTFFEIDVRTLNPDKAVVYFKTSQGEENVDIKWLKDVNMSEIQEIPKATVDYYKSLAGTGELPFNYQFIPHILYLGTVDVSGSRIITI